MCMLITCNLTWQKLTHDWNVVIFELLCVNKCFVFYNETFIIWVVFELIDNISFGVQIY